MTVAAGPAPNRWRVRAFTTLHHFLAAATLTACVVATEQWHLLDWLDAAMLRMVAPASKDPAAEGLPQLVLIDSQTYADRFALRSPLDRAQLTDIVADTLVAHPSVLVIDLQVEPAVGETPDRPLDRLLKSAARDPAGATRVVLPLPEGRTPALDASSLAWMRSMCEAGIVFGTAQLQARFGAVIRIEDDADSMAALALEGVASDHPAHEEAGRAHAEGSRGGKACALVQAFAPNTTSADLGSVFQPILEPEEGERRSEPLSPGTLKGIGDAALAWRPNSTREALKAHPHGVVVLGGDYDDRDRFLTTAGNQLLAGAAVHAAAIGGHGHVTTSEWKGVVFDGLFGTALGFVFTWLWQWAGKFKLDVHRNKHLPAWKFAWRSLGPLALACGIWIIALGIGYGLMKASSRLLECGLWMNPGPVVLGMFLHALLLKDEGGCHHEAHGPYSWRSFTHHAPAWPVQVLLAGMVFGWLLLKTSAE